MKLISFLSKGNFLSEENFLSKVLSKKKLNINFHPDDLIFQA